MCSLRFALRLVVAGIALVVLGSLAQAQRFLGRGVEDWVRDLKDKKAAVRRGAAFALGKIGNAVGPRADVLGELLEKDPDASVREAAAFALGEINSPTARTVGALEKVLASKKEDARVRRGAAYALGCFGEEADKALPDLVAALAASEPEVRQCVAWALGQMGPKAGADGVRGLCEALADKDPLVRRDAAAALGNIGRGERGRREEERSASRHGIGALLQCCKAETDPEVRRTALGALVNVVGPQHQKTDKARGVRELLNQLRREQADPEDVREAALALGNIGGPEAADAVPVLREALRNPDDLEVRQLASAALASVGKSAATALPDLISALKDPDRQVRRNAALALGHLEEKAEDAVPALIKRLEPPDSSEDVQRYALEALAYIGSKAARDALPTLKAVLKSNRAWPLRQRAVWVMGNLTSDELRQVVPDLEPVLKETSRESRLVRYETAVLLGHKLGPDAPAGTREVLLENLNDRELKIYEGSGAAVSGTTPEAKGGAGTVTEKLTGDARYLPARALERIGPKAGQGDVGKKIIASLKEAAKAEDEKVREAAREALKKITGD
jgi:HEAT repeat protein